MRPALGWMLAASAMLPCAAATAVASDEPLRFLMASISPTGGAVDPSEPAIPVGSRVTLVSPETPQRTFDAVVAQRKDECREFPAAVGAQSCIELTHVQPIPDERVVVVAVVGALTVDVVAGVAELRPAGTDDRVRLRSCTSHEGIHFTAWAGAAGDERRLWHAYWYLGFDVEPTCTQAEVEP